MTMIRDTELLIDIERERDVWEHFYERLPRASEATSFNLYWPVIASA